MEQKEVLLIIPAYNEEKTIGKVMDQLAQPEIADLVDVLVMNDASSDNTNWMVKTARLCGSNACFQARLRKRSAAWL